ncbi:SRPBCC family protein [Arthrobacter sp. ISL-72]|uniref:SRPBCC family protein n=1 Tax=Arthrobacter sp. ISL-72 TaxID=2819114 RepID=UPI001BE7B77A|nr:SRPBCC family protein [Arthrobacter sp. ISL-72]MBT2598031.1 SRPBCC family protein [Arthrobacter sp. ISL-72]
MATPITHASFTLERRLNAAPSRVFHAFSDYSSKKKWFGGPPEWFQGESSLDFREGGTETDVGGPVGGFVSTMHAIYHDIVENERIVYSYEMLLDGQRASVSLSTVELAPDGDGTLLTLTEQGVYFTEEDQVAGRKEGTDGLLDALQVFVEQD